MSSWSGETSTWTEERLKEWLSRRMRTMIREPGKYTGKYTGYTGLDTNIPNIMKELANRERTGWTDGFAVNSVERKHDQERDDYYKMRETRREEKLTMRMQHELLKESVAMAREDIITKEDKYTLNYNPYLPHL